jgi:G2/mitotic-specific cyclin-B, other
MHPPLKRAKLPISQHARNKLQTTTRPQRTITRFAPADSSKAKIIEETPKTDCAPLEDPDYVEDMYKSFRDKETVIPSYMEKQTMLNADMRYEVVEWLMQYGKKIIPETSFLAIDIMDRFLAAKETDESSLVLTLATSVLIAFKYEQGIMIPIDTLIKQLELPFMEKVIIEWETIILKTLNYRITFPSPHNFLVRYLQVANADSVVSKSAVDFLKRTLLSYDLRRMYKPSQLAAAAVYLARQHCTSDSRLWTTELVLCSGYPTTEVKDIAGKLSSGKAFLMLN